MRTNRYGEVVLTPHEEECRPTRQPIDPEAYIAQRRLNGPLAALVRRTIMACPDISPYQLDRCIEGYMKTLYMEQGGRIR